MVIVVGKSEKEEQETRHQAQGGWETLFRVWDEDDDDGLEKRLRLLCREQLVMDGGGLLSMLSGEKIKKELRDLMMMNWSIARSLRLMRWSWGEDIELYDIFVEEYIAT